MACSNCNTPNCGCSGTYVVSQTCPPACSEVFNTACVVYTGVDIICSDTTVDPAVPTTIVRRNDYLDTALTAIVNYVCSRFNTQIHPSTVVDSGDAYILVSSAIVGAQTTYTITLDPSTLPTASIVTGGANAVVTGDGSVGTPYVVNANESIVAVDAASALTLIVDPSTPGPYETTYTIGVDASLLPVTELNTSFAHISIVPTPNSPNAGDTTYTLEVDEVTITSVDAKIDVVNTAAGGIAPFERTFTVDINEAEMSDFIMDTAGANIIGNGGIIVTYDAIDHEITISETIGLPNIWFTLGNAGVDADISAASNTDTFNITADAVTDGLSVGLAAGPGANEATFTIVNEDRGTDQNIFQTIDCANGGVDFGTITAALNNDNFGLNGGDQISLSILGNDVTIDCDIANVFAEVVGDDGLNTSAGSTLATLEIITQAGDPLSTATAGAPGAASITINWDGLDGTQVGAGLSGAGTTADPLVNDSPATDVALASAGGTSLVSDGVGPALEVLGLSAGDGIGLSATATEITINAEVERDDTSESSTAVVATVTADLTHTLNETYVQVRIFALSTNSGFVPGDDMTSDCRIKMVAVGDYQVTPGTYTGDILAVVLG